MFTDSISFKNGAMPDYIKMAYLLYLKYGGFAAETIRRYDPHENKLEREYKIIGIVRGVKYELTLILDELTGHMKADWHGTQDDSTAQLDMYDRWGHR
jgi:hypothetical protein